MNYLLDTCLLSELTRRQPNPGVIHWLAEAEEARLFVSAITIGEIQRGIARLPENARKTELATWLNEDLIPRFETRIIPLGAQAMLAWGSLSARLEAQGRPMPAFDALIAATAIYHALILVTRNAGDFIHTGVQLLNPWE